MTYAQMPCKEFELICSGGSPDVPSSRPVEKGENRMPHQLLHGLSFHGQLPLMTPTNVLCHRSIKGKMSFWSWFKMEHKSAKNIGWHSKHSFSLSYLLLHMPQTGKGSIFSPALFVTQMDWIPGFSRSKSGPRTGPLSVASHYPAGAQAMKDSGERIRKPALPPPPSLPLAARLFSKALQPLCRYAKALWVRSRPAVKSAYER